MTYPKGIPQWRVDAALKLLGLYDQARDVTISSSGTNVKVGYNGHVLIPVTDNEKTTDVVVLGIDPENGDVQEQKVTILDALMFTGSGMYVDGVVSHQNGTKVVTMKRKQ